MMRLLEASEAVEKIRQRIAERLDWVIVAFSRYSTELASAIENEFYTGEASKDFDMILIPSPTENVRFGAIFLGRKKRVSRRQMAKFLKLDIPSDHDIFFSPDTPVEIVEWFTATFGNKDG